MTELLPCPFCGKSSRISVQENRLWSAKPLGMKTVSFSVHHYCQKDCSGTYIKLTRSTRDKAVGSWNERSHDMLERTADLYDFIDLLLGKQPYNVELLLVLYGLEKINDEEANSRLQDMGFSGVDIRNMLSNAILFTKCPKGLSDD